DLKDRKILSELDLNSRQPISQIAKRVRLSRAVTEYRIKKLENERVIQGYYTVINTSKLGYHYCRIYLHIRSITPEKDKEIIEFISKLKHVIWFSQQEYTWEIVIVALVKNLSHLNDIYKAIIYKYSDIIDNTEVSVAVKIHHFRNKFINFDPKTIYPESIIGEVSDVYELTPNEKRIIQQLKKDTKISLIQLAVKINLDVKTVSKTLNNLIHNNILLEFRPQINLKTFDLTHFHVFLTLENMDSKRESQVFQYIKAQPYTIYATECIGKPDLEFDVLVKNQEELNDFMKKFKLQFVNNIKKYFALPMSKLHRNIYFIGDE
ncbi:MAG: Lrp/AsnC family transcriptional regulator, partial [Nanoarchaeota archaeon]|nr:Lrp/AsnC family transcriptional regulator [Nanoarchaeota archaeon]